MMATNTIFVSVADLAQNNVHGRSAEETATPLARRRRRPVLTFWPDGD